MALHHGGRLLRSAVKLSLPHNLPVSSMIKSSPVLTSLLNRQFHQSVSLEHEYKIVITTGDKFGAGTDADVYINLIGANGTSSYIELDCIPEHFERGSVDEFTIDAPYLGRIHKLLVKHTSTGLSPAWLLGSIQVADGENTYKFSCDKWLEKEGGEDPITLLKEDSISESELKELSRAEGRSSDVNTDSVKQVMDQFEDRKEK